MLQINSRFLIKMDSLKNDNIETGTVTLTPILRSARANDPLYTTTLSPGLRCVLFLSFFSFPMFTATTLQLTVCELVVYGASSLFVFPLSFS